MIADEHLHLFITEELFLPKGSAPTEKTEPTPVAPPPVGQVAAPSSVAPAVPPTPTLPPKPTPVEKTSAPVLPATPPKPSPDTRPAELAIWTAPLTPSQRELLEKILIALGKKLSDVLLLEGMESYQPNFQNLVCFGYGQNLELRAKQPIPLYQVKQIGQRKFLTAAPLSQLEMDRNEKGRLWSALKVMFGLG